MDVLQYFPPGLAVGVWRYATPPPPMPAGVPLKFLLDYQDKAVALFVQWRTGVPKDDE
jgi:hypothetical protein